MLLVMINRKLFLAPIESPPGRVLDVGAGTGIWVMDFADSHPSAEIGPIYIKLEQRPL
ncbi:hypothetical protein BDV32DRAFT_119258, partial [Aspergillus pseudonomiae]